MNQVKRKIKSLMALEGINQVEMAKLLNISRQTFSKKLNGHIGFSDKEKENIAALFKTDKSAIFFANQGDELSTKLIV